MKAYSTTLEGLELLINLYFYSKAYKIEGQNVTNLVLPKQLENAIFEKDGKYYFYY